MYLRNCGCFKSAKNNWVLKSQISMSAIRGFAIYRTYLRTAHLWKQILSKEDDTFFTVAGFSPPAIPLSWVSSAKPLPASQREKY
jgi:hypothetical protein